MEDHTASSDAPKKSKKSKNVTLVMNRQVFTVLVAVVVLIVVFFLGSAYGSRNNDKNTTSRSSSSDSDNGPTSSRWTTVGTVQEISDSKIKVKDSRDQEKEATIDKDTKIVDRKGTTLKSSDIKKDQRVIVSGDKDGDKLTATRIRLQQ